MTQPSRPPRDAAIHLDPDTPWHDLEGEGFDLEERVASRDALRRVAGIRTDLQDVTEVEYRQLRLERVVLMGVYPRGDDADTSLFELKALAETAGCEVLEGLLQRKDKPDPKSYVGSGKALELRDAVLASGADTVICDGELSPGQLRALEEIVKVKVIDRTWLILDIFAQHATSSEGKAQVELAQMTYMLPRLRGWGACPKCSSSRPPCRSRTRASGHSTSSSKPPKPTPVSSTRPLTCTPGCRCGGTFTSSRKPCPPALFAGCAARSFSTTCGCGSGRTCTRSCAA